MNGGSTRRHTPPHRGARAQGTHLPAAALRHRPDGEVRLRAFRVPPPAATRGDPEQFAFDWFSSPLTCLEAGSGLRCPAVFKLQLPDCTTLMFTCFMPRARSLLHGARSGWKSDDCCVILRKIL